MITFCHVFKTPLLSLNTLNVDLFSTMILIEGMKRERQSQSPSLPVTGMGGYAKLLK